jgi:hypothetical protein
MTGHPEQQESPVILSEFATANESKDLHLLFVLYQGASGEPTQCVGRAPQAPPHFQKIKYAAKPRGASTARFQ